MVDRVELTKVVESIKDKTDEELRDLIEHGENFEALEESTATLEEPDRPQ